MDRRRLVPLTACAALALAGCNPMDQALDAYYGHKRKDLPITYYLDASWSEEDETVIVGAFAEWDAELGPLVGAETVFIYGGRADDAAFLMDDLEDGRFTVYRVEPLTEEIEEMKAAAGYGDISGLAAGSDILIFPGFFGTHHPSVDPRLARLADLRHTALHEAGHHLGLAHFTTEPAVMNPDWSLPHLKPADLAEACVIYDCIRDSGD